MSELQTTFVPCRDCGDLVEIAQVSCSDCSPPIPEMDELEHVRVVEVPELRALIEQWRKTAQNNRNVGQRHDANQIERCARGLEELIDD